ncbi:hypothetical protein ACJX0J_023789, partial [Zea mays]
MQTKGGSEIISVGYANIYIPINANFLKMLSCVFMHACVDIYEPYYCFKIEEWIVGGASWAICAYRIGLDIVYFH